MKFPPAIVYFRKTENGKKRVGLWLPTLFLWPLVLLIAVATTPILLALVLIYPFASSVRRLFRRIGAAVAFGFSLRGLSLITDNGDEIMTLHIK